MDWRHRSTGWTLAALAAWSCPAQTHADESSVLRRSPIVASISDEGLQGKSPYADWPDQGMRPLPDRAVLAEEVFVSQAEAIAATYGAEPWRYQAHECAGWPTCIHSRAFPSDTGRYCGYYVGGGAAWHGEGRYAHEGTWGWDYHGFWFKRRVALGWWHGLPQSGTGAYQTDGPKVIHHE